MLRLLDPQELAKYNGMTPLALDFLGNYTDAVDGCQFVIDEQQNADGRTNCRLVVYMPGATETVSQQAKSTATCPRSFVSFPSSALSHDMNRTLGNVYGPRPRGSWKLKAIYAGSPDAKRTDKYYSIPAIRCM